MTWIEYVRSNTIVGDRAHAKGMVVARIIKGNIPVKNGVVHLIEIVLLQLKISLLRLIQVKMGSADHAHLWEG